MWHTRTLPLALFGPFRLLPWETASRWSLSRVWPAGTEHECLAAREFLSCVVGDAQWEAAAWRRRTTSLSLCARRQTRVLLSADQWKSGMRSVSNSVTRWPGEPSTGETHRA